MAETDLTIAFIGCGNMGSAVLDGLLSATSPTANPPDDPASQPHPRISTFIAYTRSPQSAQKLSEKYRSDGDRGPRVLTMHTRIADAIRPADVVVLGFKPYMARAVLGAPDVRAALAQQGAGGGGGGGGGGGKKKLVISMLAGPTAAEIRALCSSSSTSDDDDEGPVVTKAIPNVAARHRQSMTVLEAPPDAADVPERAARLTEWLFGLVGGVKWVAPELVGAAAALMTACMAALSVPVEGLLDGAVAEGLRRDDAMEVALQGVLGLAAVLRSGTHPAVMRESISSPRGSTVQSLLVVERAGTRAVFADALIAGARHLQPSGGDDKVSGR